MLHAQLHVSTVVTKRLATAMTVRLDPGTNFVTITVLLTATAIATVALVNSVWLAIGILTVALSAIVNVGVKVAFSIPVIASIVHQVSMEVSVKRAVA